MGDTYHQIGEVYERQQQWQQALDAYQRALELQEEHAKSERIDLTYQQIGFIHELQGDLPLAGGYYDLALAAEQKLDEPSPRLLRAIQESRQRANCEQQDS